MRKGEGKLYSWQAVKAEFAKKRNILTDSSFIQFV